MTGTATSFTGPGAGATYSIVDAAADYGSVPAGQLASCFDATADCYSVTAYAPSRPSLHWDATFQETLSDTSVRSWPLHVGRSFSDVPSTRGDYRYVETVLHRGITSGCGGTVFCPDGNLSRAQMAVFLLRAEHGAAYVPPPATGSVFGDVPAGAFAAAWIEQLAAEGITAGCGNGADFCPNAPVTRAQMAVFLLKTEHGSSWVPPAASGDFSDVPVGEPVRAVGRGAQGRGRDGGVRDRASTAPAPPRAAARWRSSSRRGSGSPCTGRSRGRPTAACRIQPRTWQSNPGRGRAGGRRAAGPARGAPRRAAASCRSGSPGSHGWSSS